MCDEEILYNHDTLSVHFEDYDYEMLQTILDALYEFESDYYEPVDD